MINNCVIYQFFQDFTNHRKKTNRAVVFSRRPFSNILKYRDPGFPTGVEKMGGSSKFDERRLKSIHWGSMGDLKCCRKIPVREFI